VILLKNTQLPQPEHNQKREKNKGKQNYLCKGTLSWVKNRIKIMSVRGAGIRDMGIIRQISTTTVLKVLALGKYKIKTLVR
jgi:hypothetical protein